jgi:hypothetical protein
VLKGEAAHHCMEWVKFIIVRNEAIFLKKIDAFEAEIKK